MMTEIEKVFYKLGIEVYGHLSRHIVAEVEGKEESVDELIRKLYTEQIKVDDALFACED